MKQVLFFMICLLFYACSGSKQYGQPIGAEKLLAYTQPGYKPKNKKERAEQKAALEQIKKDMEQGKKETKKAGYSD
ncbi:MAG: hypothetical protein ACOVNY_07535 [Chitinophagaceae bacterium]